MEDPGQIQEKDSSNTNPNIMLLFNFKSLDNILHPTDGFLGIKMKEIFEEIELEEHVIILSLLKTIKLIKKCWKCLPNRSLSNEEIFDIKKQIVQEIDSLNILRDDYVWEHLNIGHWKSVRPVWRKTYTFITLLKVVLLLLKEDSFEEVIKQCDLGLLMGEPILGNILSCIAEEIGTKVLSTNYFEDSSLDSFMDNEPDESRQFSLPNQFLKSKFDIEYFALPSLERFATVLKNSFPIIITKGINHWPAFKKWNVKYIQEVAGFRTCPVEIGAKYTSEDWTQKFMTINEFVNKFMKNKQETSQPKDFGYIAQHHLFDQIPKLRKDIIIPDFCSLGSDKNVEINAWFGPANTISPTHYDPKHNLLVQVFGTKIVRLYPPSETELLEPYPLTSLLFNTSQLDLEDPFLFDNHPRVKNAKYCEFLLKPGMMLYMPPKWWHYIKSLTPCFSVSFWFE